MWSPDDDREPFHIGNAHDIPARIVVERRHDETVACPADDTIVSAPPPARIVEKGKLADTFIVEALCDKYVEHQPIERQCTRFARAGVEVAPQTLGCDVGAAIDLLRPVADLIADKTREPGLLGTDATGIPILDPGALEGIGTGTVWAWTNARWVTFFYSPSGDAASVRAFLGETLPLTADCRRRPYLCILVHRLIGARPRPWRPASEPALHHPHACMRCKLRSRSTTIPRSPSRPSVRTEKPVPVTHPQMPTVRACLGRHR